MPTRYSGSNSAHGTLCSRRAAADAIAQLRLLIASSEVDRAMPEPLTDRERNILGRLASGADAALALARASASTGTGQVFCNYGSDWSPPVGSAPTG